MKNKASKRYSYVNHDSRESKFIHKNFNKTESYHTNFSGVIFQNTSFVGAKLKFCALHGAVFDNCFIRGSLFRCCNLRAAVFKNSIISATIFDRCKLNGCIFDNCKIISSTKLDNFLSENCFHNTEFFTDFPPEENFNPVLIDIIEELRENYLIRQSSVLHRKKGKLDTISLAVLVENFNEEFLIEHLQSLPNLITTPFHTLSYIAHILHKIRDRDIKALPGPAALGTPKLTNA